MLKALGVDGYGVITVVMGPMRKSVRSPSEIC
jgi:hypothetical protein